MSINLKTRKMLWGRSGNKCAFPLCQKSLAETETEEYSVIGDEAHIVAKEIKGPRGISNLSIEERDSFNNLLLLCKNHHKIIDDNPEKYTVQALIKIKKDHLDWVNKSLTLDINEQKNDELYADYIDKIENLSNFDKWLDWTIFLLGGHFTKIEKQQYNNLIQLHKYLCERIYPESRKTLTKAINQFKIVLEDFINHFNLYHLDSNLNDDFYITQQLYRLNVVTPAEQNLHEFMLEELIIELTKAGNFLCSEVRKTISPTYKLNEGILLLNDAPAMGITYRRFIYNTNGKYCGLNKIRERTKKQLRLIN